ncbi:MAG: MMPL family transporter, partial [Planctomycetota bacterium]
RSASASAALARRRLAAPVTCSLATTATAFFLLPATGVPAFRSSGVIVGAGVLAVLPVVLLGLPTALSSGGFDPSARRWIDLRPLLARLGRLALRGAAPWVLGGAVACGLGALFAARAPVRVEVFHSFRPASNIARTYRFLEGHLTASLYFDLLLEARRDAEPLEVLADLERFERRALSFPEIHRAQSLASLVRHGDTVNRQLLPGWDALPSEVRRTAALRFLRAQFREITERFEESEERFHARRTAALPGGSGEPGRLYRLKVRLLDGSGPEAFDTLRQEAGRLASGRTALSGLYPRAVDTARRLISDLMKGAAWMLLLGAALVAAFVGSLRLGLAALLPNLLPPFVVFGCASLLGASFDVSAVAVASVAVGLAVDDTYHFLFRYRAERRCGRAVGAALLRTERSVGRAIILSTLVLAAGLLCLGLSAFRPTANFGLYTALSSVAALGGDLLVLPAAILLVGGRRARRRRL